MGKEPEFIQYLDSEKAIAYGRKKDIEAAVKKATKEVKEKVTKKVTKEVTKEVSKQKDIETAKKMLKETSDISFISRISGLSKKEITNLKSCNKIN